MSFSSLSSANTLVVGGGIFGLTAALSLHQRGHRVTLLEAGALPNPLAATTDISKVIRMEYGPDAAYMALGELAHAGWHQWNAEWQAAGEAPLYHETGVLMCCRQPMAPSGFEYESWKNLLARGHTPERMDAETLAARFPAWQTGRYVDGFFHAKGGYAESGRVLSALAQQARRAGIAVQEQARVVSLVASGARITGVALENGETYTADAIVLATGAWTRQLLPHLHEAIRPTGHPVFHLKPRDPEPFEAPHFPVFTADIARTGYYGFPLHRTGVVKIGNHGPGLPQEADAARALLPDEPTRLRHFLEATFPRLLDAEIVYTRLCLYADTQDEDFWIAQDPDRPGLTVASGGSGHGFKFAPILGPLIADAVEGHANPALEKFAWRPSLRLAQGKEAARCHITT